MSSTDLIVFGMCALMIAAGVAVLRLSTKQRAMGVLGIVLGVIGLLAYLTAEEGAPPPNTTPTASASTAPADATPGATAES